MKPELLPDDPAIAEQIVKLLNDKVALLKTLRRMREERDFWRNEAMKRMEQQA